MILYRPDPLPNERVWLRQTRKGASGSMLDFLGPSAFPSSEFELTNQIAVLPAFLLISLMSKRMQGLCRRVLTSKVDG